MAVIKRGAGAGWRHRPRRRPPPPPTHRWGAGGSRGVQRARARVGVRHTAASRPAAASRKRGAQVRWCSRGAGWSWPAHGPRVPRLRRPPPRLVCFHRSTHGMRACIYATAGGCGLVTVVDAAARSRLTRRGRALCEIARPRVLFMAGLPFLASRLRGCAALRSARAIKFSLFFAGNPSSWPVSGSLPSPRDARARVRGTGFRVRLLPFGLGPPLGAGGGGGRGGPNCCPSFDRGPLLLEKKECLAGCH